MLNNVSFKACTETTKFPAKQVSRQTAIPHLKQDMVTFSKKVSSKKIATKKEIEQRISDFKKLLGDKQIPKEVMKVLNNPEIKLNVSPEILKGSDLGIVKNTIKKGSELLLPKSISDKIVNKITPKMNADINTLAVRLNKLKILDKSEGIFRGKGECYILSMVSDGASEPIMLKVDTIQGIKDGDDLFDKGLQRPYTVYLTPPGNVPRLLDFRLLVMEEDKKESRKAIDILNAVTGDSKYKDIVAAIAILVKSASPAGAIFTLVDSAVNVAKAVLECNEDDQLLYYAARFTKDFDNLGVGKYDNKYDKVELGYEIIAK